MTPKEKAKQLFEQFFNVSDELNKYPMCFDTAKSCAIICAIEMLNVCDFKTKAYLNEVLKELKNFKL